MAEVVERSLTAELAEFAVGIGADAIPRAGIETIRGCFLDFVGVAAFAARAINESTVVAAALDEMDSQTGEHVVVGALRTRSRMQAVFLNGTHAHTLDFDDTNQPGLLHPGAPVIPAALAAAETAQASGEDFLGALTVGYEVACRVGRALGDSIYERGFHPTAIAGLFGATAAAARLQRVSPAVLDNAFGLCGSRAAGSMQFLLNGSWNKRMHPGFAAHDALWCIALAQAGAIGAAEALEGRHGVLASYAPAGKPGELVRGLGADWLCEQTAIKPYPSCRFTHAAVDAALVLRTAPMPVSQPRLRVRMNPAALGVVGQRTETKVRPRTVIDAQFSVYFQLAVAWEHGSPTWESYDRIGDPVIEALAERIVVEPASELPLSAAEVSVEGTTLRTLVEFPLGEPQRPLTWADIEKKFRSLSHVAYSNERAEAISHAIKTLGKDHSMPDIATLLRGQARPGQEGT